MGAMPGNVSKGAILEKFEDHINSHPDNLVAAMTEYKKWKNDKNMKKLMKWARETQKVLGKKDDDHVRAHWFPEAFEKGVNTEYKKRPWWKEQKPMGRVVRAGLIKALNLCRYKYPTYDQTDPNDPKSNERDKPYLPIDAHWICAGSHFEMVVTLGHKFVDVSNPGDPANYQKQESHVNLLFMTPSPPFTRHEHRHEDPNAIKMEDIWVLRHADTGPGEMEEGTELATKRHVRTSRLMKGTVEPDDD